MGVGKKTRCLDKRLGMFSWGRGRHNLYPGLNLSKYFEGGTVGANRSGCLPYSFDYPKPFTNDCIPLTKQWKDIGSHIVEQHLEHNKQLHFLKEKMVCNKRLCRIWKTRLKQRDLTTKGEGPFSIYPVELIDYTKLLELNPEPEFQGLYNWYLTGGCLSVIQHNDKNYVVRPYGEELNHLDITPVHKKGKHLSTAKTTRIDLSTGGAIHEICTKSHAEELLVVTRNKSNIGFLRQGSDTALSNFESKVPYVSCDLSSDFHLATTNTDKQLRIYDLSTQKTRGKFDLEYVASLLPDNWSCVRSLQSSDCYLFADRRNLRPIDTRTKVKGSPFNITDYGDICDFISCVTPSQRYEHLIYVGTSHRLFALDLRNFSGVIDDQNMSLSWTHMMNLPPCMIKTAVIDEAEMICISSNLPGDMRVVLTEYGTEYKNLYLPVKPPSAADSLQLAKDNYVCLNPISSVNRRVRLCLTGMDFMTTFSGKTSIISQNSICDVFKQNVITGPDDVVEVCKRMKTWMDDVDAIEEEEPKTKEFGATAVLYKKDMVRVFKSTRLARPNKIEEELEAAKPKQRPRWQRSVTELANYKDALVESIMEVWDFPIDDKAFLRLPKSEPEPLKKRIQSWFDKCHFDATELMDETQVMDVTKTDRASPPSQDQPLNETMDTSYVEFAGEFNIVQTSTQQNTEDTKVVPVLDQEFVKPATKTKRKRHVMGF